MPPRVETVPAEAVRPLRRLVLRPGQPYATTRYAEDDAPGAVHVAVVLADAPTADGIVSIASGFPEPVPAQRAPRLPVSNRATAFRLRGMATHPDVRGRGYGRLAFEGVRRHAAEAGAAVLWFNARLGAQAFYERLGCRSTGPEFEIEGIGAHVVMWCGTCAEV